MNSNCQNKVNSLFIFVKKLSFCRNLFTLSHKLTFNTVIFLISVHLHFIQGLHKVFIREMILKIYIPKSQKCMYLVKNEAFCGHLLLLFT